MSATPEPDFGHLLDMSDRRGTYEHAELTVPRHEHGYCTDDMARVLVVTTREARPTAAVRLLSDLSLRFLGHAQDFNGRFHNRLSERGRWTDRASVDDCWGRSVWALGTAAAGGRAEWIRQTALVHFERAARQRSRWPRAMAYAAIGAAELLAAQPANRGARDLLVAAAGQFPVPADDAGWPWPEPRLTYADAVLPEAMIAAGAVLEDPLLLAKGLGLLRWLLDHETIDGHLSLTPVGGAGAGDWGPAFDQQPIEVAALADACARAAVVDGNPGWIDGLAAAVAWFLGDNDGGHVMWDHTTGGGYDGLEADGLNHNQGTESTLALLSTLQHGRRLVPVAL